MWKSIKYLLAAALLLALATGCGGGPGNAPQDPARDTGTETAGQAVYPITIVDSLDREITMASEPQKIVSLSPAITEILFAIGTGDKIVGVTNYCDYPQEALDKPKIGDFTNPNLEVIISSEPDVIFIAAGIQVDLVRQFEDLGIKVITLDASSLQQVLNNIETAGRVTGNVAQATELVTALRQRIGAVQETIARAASKPEVFFEVWDDPLMTAGPGSFIDDLISMAGGTNIASDTTKRFAEFSREMLLERNPEIYILNSHAHTPDDVKSRPGYSGLEAIKMDRVYTIEDDLVTLPGPRIVEGLEEMAMIIHPELY